MNSRDDDIDLDDLEGGDGEFDKTKDMKLIGFTQL